MSVRRRALQLPALSAISIVALAVATYLAFAPGLFNDGDTGWHLAAGQWIVAHRAVPDTDPFSFTMRGHPWTAHEWLAEVVMALVLKIGGWRGLALLFAVAFGATLWLVGRSLDRSLPPRYAIVSLAGVAAILAPGALARPHLLAWPLLALWLSVLVRARLEHRAPHVASALLITIWANLHASYIIGLAIAAAFALEALVEETDRRNVIVGWGSFGLASLAAVFITPHGIQGFLYPFQVSSMKALPLIGEWRAAQLPKDLPFALFAAAIAGVAIARWRRIGVVRIAMIAGLGVLGVLHARHQAVFAIAAAIALLPRAFTQVDRVVTRRNAVTLAVAVVVLAAVRLAIPLNRPSTPNWPMTALAVIPTDLRSAPVLNSYSFGGPMIFTGLAPFIDGRADMYGDGFTLAHQRMMHGDMAEFDAAARHWKLRWVILHPQERLAGRLSTTPGWRRLYADRQAVIFVHD